MMLVTYIPRVLPLTLFNRKINSTYIRSVLYYMPYAVLAAMTFPSVFYKTDNTIYAIIGTVVALFMGYLEKSLLVVAIAAVASIYFCHFI